MAGELAVERADDVVRPEREPGAGGDRLLPAAVVERAGDPPLPVERDDALLDQPLQEHERKSSSRVVARDAAGTRRRAQ